MQSFSRASHFLPKIRIGFRTGALGALGVIGLLVVGGIYLKGERYELALQESADEAAAANYRFASVLNSLAEARQAETDYALHGGEPLTAIHDLTLDKGRTVLGDLLADPALSETSRAGARLLLKLLNTYSDQSDTSMRAQAAIGLDDDSALTAVRQAADATEQAFLPCPNEPLCTLASALRPQVAIFTMFHDRATIDRFNAQASLLRGKLVSDGRLDEAARDALAQVVSAYQRAFNAYAEDSATAAQTAFASGQAYQDARVAAEAARGISNGQADTEQAALRRAREATFRLMQLTILLAVAAIAGLAWLIGRGIARPLTVVAQQTNQLAHGRRDTIIRHTRRGDEIGDVARSLAIFRAAMEENEAASRRIHDLAHYDSLTGLGNRVLLRERLADAVALARRDERTFSVLCLDLDGFKAVNDLYGHSAGDALLREVAARLGRNLRENDFAGRLGGDEFVVIQDSPTQPGASKILVERLMKAVAEPYDVGTTRIGDMVTTSIGVAIYPVDGTDPDTLLRNADIALYRAKAAGKNIAAFFEQEMDHHLRECRALERDLGQALAKGEMSLAWQPLAEAADGNEVTGYEVLLRWRRPEHGPVSPDIFIPVAESTGAIITIGEWVLREACREATRWPTPLGVAVNVSPVQAQQGEIFAAMVERALEETGLAPSRLTLEVTEGVLIRDPDRVLAALRRVKARGVRIALDDFGTGYSSLATLRAFPFDKIKIDRSFITGIAAGGQDAAIVRAVLGLARGLGLPAVAEGVETEEQLDVLRKTGCEEVQGWLIGRPAPISSFHAVKELSQLEKRARMAIAAPDAASRGPLLPIDHE